MIISPCVSTEKREIEGTMVEQTMDPANSCVIGVFVIPLAKYTQPYGREKGK